MKNRESEKVSETINLVVFPIVSILIICILFVFGIKPSLEKILEAKSELSKNESKLTQLDGKVKDLSSFKETEIRSRVETLSKVLPSDKSVPGLLSGLERMAAEASAAVETFSIAPGKISTPSGQASFSALASSVQAPQLPSTPETSGLPLSIDFDLSLQGNFEGLRTFLTSLSNSARILGVKSVNFSGQGVSSSSDSLSTLISLKAYYLPYPTSLGAFSEPAPKLTSSEEKIYEKAASFKLYSIPPGFGPAGKNNPFSKF